MIALSTRAAPAAWAVALMAACALAQPPADRYLQAVRTFADNVISHGRDTYGPKKTPLFVDGLNVDTRKPPVWKHKKQQWVLSNLASQQNLFRVLAGLSAATGDKRYRQAAEDATRYALEHLQDAGGLLRWGGHAAYDALGDRFVGEGVKHELKHHYPYYELMWRVDRRATRRLLEAIWAAHVVRWDMLDVDRHGRYGKQRGKLWDHEYKGGPVPFVGRGLSFMLSGTDFVYAAAMLSRFTGEAKPMTWALRLTQRYMDARDPKTKLGASNFSTRSNQRMAKQFPQFKGRFTEATVADLYGARYTHCAFCLLRLGQTLGRQGKPFVDWGLEELTARAANGYDEKTSTFQAMLIDGTPLSPADRKKDGYVKVEWLRRRKADGRHLLAYALAYRLTRDPRMWRMVRSIARGLGLGDLGAEGGKGEGGAREVAVGDPLVIFALLEIHQATKRPADLDLARRVAEVALARRFHKGFFVASARHAHAYFDDPTPLALLHLRAALLSAEPEKRPPLYWMGRGYFHCPFDGLGRTYDHRAIYSLTRGAARGRD